MPPSASTTGSTGPSSATSSATAGTWLPGSAASSASMPARRGLCPPAAAAPSAATSPPPPNGLRVDNSKKQAGGSLGGAPATQAAARSVGSAGLRRCPFGGALTGIITATAPLNPWVGPVRRLKWRRGLVVADGTSEAVGSQRGPSSSRQRTRLPGLAPSSSPKYPAGGTRPPGSLGP